MRIQTKIDLTMKPVCRAVRRLLHEESGQDLIEYALVFSLIALGAVASMKSLSTSLANLFTAVGTTLTTST